MTDERCDHELLHAALEGDARIMRALVERLLPTVHARVMQALLRYKGSHQAAQAVEDLTQQVLLSLFEGDGRKLRAWTPGRGASLSTFVGLLTEREVIGILRRGRRNPWTESPTEGDELARRVGTADGHEAAVASRELLDVVLDRALATLDERGLQLFQRLIVDEAAVDLVAREMSSTTAALHMWKSRFTRLVREIADEVGGEKRSPPTRHSPMAFQHAWRTR